MILDKENLFSDAQAITAAAGSTNTIDLGIARNIGVGEELFVSVTVDTAFTDGSSDSYLDVALEGDSTESFTPDGTTTIGRIPALAAAGDKFLFRIPVDFVNNYRYIRLKYTPGNGNLTTGAVTAGIVKNGDAQTNYPKGYTIA